MILYSMSISEMFYRLFRADWLPGQDVVWRIATGNPAQRYQDLPIDGILFNFVAMILAVMLVDWVLKAVRRYI